MYEKLQNNLSNSTTYTRPGVSHPEGEALSLYDVLISLSPK